MNVSVLSIRDQSESVGFSIEIKIINIYMKG